MFRLLIVDDNNRDRRVLQEVIDWNALDIEVIGTAADGKEALMMIKTLDPHIVLTDIAMPALNGVEMAEILKRQYSHIKIIFMSCYDDFEFARSAINLSIYGYIMKPIIPKELKEVVCKVLNIYEHEIEQKEETLKMMKQIEESLPMVQEEFFRELVYGLNKDEEDIWKKVDFLKLNLNGFKKVQIMSVAISDYEKYMSDKNVSVQYLLCYSIKDMINSLSHEDLQLFTIQNSGSEFIVIAFSMTKDVNDSDEEIIERSIDIYSKLNDKFNINVTIGISKVSVNILDLSLLLNQSVSALKTKFYAEDNPVILYREIEEKTFEDFEKKVNLEGLSREVKEVVQSREDQDIIILIDKYFQSGPVFQTEAYYKSLTFSIINIVQINLIEVGKSFYDIFGDDIIIWKKLVKFDTIVNLKLWLFNVLKSVSEFINDKNTSRDMQIVKKIKEFIHQKYYEQITINDIADVVFLSSKQANKIFKRETGRTIFDYLVEHRIEVAKKLMKDPFSKVYQVAEDVGYINKSHFCLIFKKATGYSPVEYRNQTAT